MADIDNVVKGLGLAALHLNNLAQKGTKYSALHADADCCLEAIGLLKEQQERIETLESLRRIEQEGR